MYEGCQAPFQFIAGRGGKIAKAYNVYLTQNNLDPKYNNDEFQDFHAISSKFLINKEGIDVW
ncbi:MAG: hypothetical protein ACFFD2_27630 [Promethearchaeota archaeon]